MTISTEEIETTNIGDIISAYDDMLGNWLSANGFIEKDADIYGHPPVSKRMYIAKRAIIVSILAMINRYGPTGFDDKPTGMDVVEYWLAHVDYDRLVEMKFNP